MERDMLTRATSMFVAGAVVLLVSALAIHFQQPSKAELASLMGNEACKGSSKDACGPTSADVPTPEAYWNNLMGCCKDRKVAASGCNASGEGSYVHKSRCDYDLQALNCGSSKIYIEPSSGARFCSFYDYTRERCTGRGNCFNVVGETGAPGCETASETVSCTGDQGFGDLSSNCTSSK